MSQMFIGLVIFSPLRSVGAKWIAGRTHVGLDL
jgi:hypothetical protein